MSQKAVGEIIRKALADGGFRRRLFSDPNAALAGYDLTQGEVEAVRLSLEAGEGAGPAGDLEPRISRARLPLNVLEGLFKPSGLDLEHLDSRTTESRDAGSATPIALPTPAPQPGSEEISATPITLPTPAPQPGSEEISATPITLPGAEHGQTAGAGAVGSLPVPIPHEAQGPHATGTLSEPMPHPAPGSESGVYGAMKAMLDQTNEERADRRAELHGSRDGEGQTADGAIAGKLREVSEDREAAESQFGAAVVAGVGSAVTSASVASNVGQGPASEHAAGAPQGTERIGEMPEPIPHPAPESAGGDVRGGERPVSSPVPEPERQPRDSGGDDAGSTGDEPPPGRGEWGPSTGDRPADSPFPDDEDVLAEEEGDHGTDVQADEDEDHGVIVQA